MDIVTMGSAIVITYTSIFGMAEAKHFKFGGLNTASTSQLTTTNPKWMWSL